HLPGRVLRPAMRAFLRTWRRAAPRLARAPRRSQPVSAARGARRSASWPGSSPTSRPRPASPSGAPFLPRFRPAGHALPAIAVVALGDGELVVADRAGGDPYWLVAHRGSPPRLHS